MDIKKVLSIVYYIGMALVFIGVLMGMSDLEYNYMVLLIGSLPIIGVRIYNWIIGLVENRRVNSILVYSSLFLLPAVWAMYTGRSYWVVFILMVAVLDTFASFRRFKK